MFLCIHIVYLTQTLKTLERMVIEQEEEEEKTVYLPRITQNYWVFGL
jgi:hypothetical protein